MTTYLAKLDDDRIVEYDLCRYIDDDYPYDKDIFEFLGYGTVHSIDGNPITGETPLRMKFFALKQKGYFSSFFGW
jgi:hypothetical protein